LRPSQTDVLRLKAESLRRQRLYQEAGATLDHHLATAPTAGRVQVQRRAQAHMTRGGGHVEPKQLRPPLEKLPQGPRPAPRPDTVALGGGASLACGAAVSPALRDFEEALELRPGSADPLLGRASARVKLGKVKEALTDVEQGLRKALADAEQGLRNGEDTRRM